MSKEQNTNTEAHPTAEEQLHQNPFLSMVVEKDSKLKEYLVEYVGTKLDSEEITVNMIAEVLAVEFPEFVLTVAEENWIRGYQQAMVDVEVGERLIDQELKNSETDEQS